MSSLSFLYFSAARACRRSALAHRRALGLDVEHAPAADVVPVVQQAQPHPIGPRPRHRQRVPAHVPRDHPEQLVVLGASTSRPAIPVEVFHEPHPVPRASQERPSASLTARAAALWRETNTAFSGASSRPA